MFKNKIGRNGKQQAIARPIFKQTRRRHFQAEQAREVCCSWTDALTKLSNSFYPGLCSRPSDWTAIPSLCFPNPLLTPVNDVISTPCLKPLNVFKSSDCV